MKKYFIILITLMVIYFMIDYMVHRRNVELLKQKFPKNTIPDLDESIQLPKSHIHDKNIPLIVHRTYMDKERAEKFQKAEQLTNQSNPSLKTKFYSDQDVEKYIQDNFSERIYNAYQNINPKYGPAKADFFRYLVVYMEGGLYFDIKSYAKSDITSVFSDPKLHVSKGRNKGDAPINRFGIFATFQNSYDWSEFSGIDYGEYNNWHFLAPPRHPVLGKVIQQMVSNIEYGKKHPEAYNYGEYSVLALTGPIMFTRVIEKYKQDVSIHEPGLDGNVSYSCINHKRGNKNHYSKLEDKQLIK